MDKKDPFDFCIINEQGKKLSQFERLTLIGGDELEKALDWIAKQVGNISFDKKLSEFDIDSVAQSCSYYAQERWIKNPRSFFVPPKTAPKVIETPLHGIPDGEIVDLEFESAYVEHNPAFKEIFDEAKENQTVHARIWKHHTPPQATLLALHGWTMGDQRLNALAFLPGFFYRLGLDVVLVELPFHGRRAPKNGKLSSDFFPSADISLTNEGMGQIISDLREVSLYIQSKHQSAIGCIGMSLGGYASALWASLDPLSFIIPIVPLVSMGELVWNLLKNHSKFSEIQAAGLTVENFKSAFHLHCPLTYSPLVPRERRFIIAGLGDSIVPPSQPQALWEHWDRPRIHWLSGGHVAQFKGSKIFYDVNLFLHELGYATLPEYCRYRPEAG